MMDAVLGARVRKVVYMTSTQVGKTEVMHNQIGFAIAVDPKPMMMVRPTIDDAKHHSKTRIQPMINNSPALRARVREATTRRPGNEVRLKEFDGGFLKLAGANSATGLASDPIALLFLDEVDLYPEDVDNEGNPVEIAARRLDTFPRSLQVMASTPGKTKGLSRIEAEYELSDQRHYHVRCPFCGFFQVLCWRDDKGFHRLRWEKDAEGKPIPDSVRYLCARCNQGIEEKHKRRMLDLGRWVALFPGREVPGFHLNALYSPWQFVWGALAREWTVAKDDPEKLRTFVNKRLAETWDEGADTSLTSLGLSKRLEKLPQREEKILPAEVCVLTASADVQHNRLEAQITGWGPGEECWLLDYEIFWGNPGAPTESDNVWEQLDRWLLSRWRHPSGVELGIACTLVDSGFQGGGAHTDSVYDFVLPRQNSLRRVFACKGVEHLSRPGLVAEGTSKRAHIRLFTVATYAAKDRFFARLKILAPGPGYIHLPEWATEEHLEQLTSEVKVLRRVRRTRGVKREYVKTRLQNEALDNMVYNFAALAALQQFIAPAVYRDLRRLWEKLGAEAPEKSAPLQRQDWIRGWRR